jgi:hypothetical protein
MNTLTSEDLKDDKENQAKLDTLKVVISLK